MTKYWILFITTLLVCATILFYPFKHMDNKLAVTKQCDAAIDGGTVADTLPPVVVQPINYPNEKIAQEYIEDCLPMCHHPRRPEDEPGCKCWCNAKGQNIRESKYIIKSFKEAKQFDRANEFELSKEQILRCFAK